MGIDPRMLQRGNLLQRLLGSLAGSDPRRATRSGWQGGRRNLSRRALDQHFEAAAFWLRQKDDLLLQVPPDAPLLPEAVHLPLLQPGAKEHHSRVKHYPQDEQSFQPTITVKQEMDISSGGARSLEDIV